MTEHVELHRLGIKWLAQEKEALDLLELIPVFHRWIRERALDDLLIDTAEYTHMHHGPGVMIIALHGNYGYDETGGERGLVYYSKQPLPQADLGARLVEVARRGLEACVRLMREPELKERVSFPGDRLVLFVNDRLAVPNTHAAWESFASAVQTLATRLYPDQTFEIARDGTDPRARLSATIRAGSAPGAENLLVRVSGA
jgi:hypothetical protein